MSNIIKELISEHVCILKHVEILKNSKDSPEIIRNSYFQLKELLITHLKKEDEELYPLLKKIAKDDPNRSRLLAKYINEIITISGEILNFFSLYKEPESGINFIADLGTVIGKLSVRISFENNIFFKEFEKDVEDMS
jgi:iron-sulfur cluster repair protein YtfE (RIC family)